MNDWWLDPPDEVWEPEPNYDTLEEYHMDDPSLEAYEPEPPPLCPHGNQWGACDTCDFLSDIAYDAAREKR